jgi:CDP-diacylglycerol--glycerol-3-phosphate 3-phosphatidyltransferase
MNIPTKITTARIVLIVGLLIALFVISLIPNFAAPMVGNTPINWVSLSACIVFVIAASTDYLDGHLARKWNQVTALGKFLDPIADKLLVNSMLIFFAVPAAYLTGQNTYVPVFCVIVMIARDLVVDGLRLIAVEKNQVIAANIFGKMKTVFQMVAIPAVMLNNWPFSYFDSTWGVWRISLVLVYLATAMSLISGIIYVVQNRKVLVEAKHE